MRELVSFVNGTELEMMTFFYCHNNYSIKKQASPVVKKNVWASNIVLQIMLGVMIIFYDYYFFFMYFFFISF